MLNKQKGKRMLTMKIEAKIDREVNAKLAIVVKQ